MRIIMQFSQKSLQDTPHFPLLIHVLSGGSVPLETNGLTVDGVFTGNITLNKLLKWS
jgi:hypothetical protein